MSRNMEEYLTVTQKPSENGARSSSQEGFCGKQTLPEVERFASVTRRADGWPSSVRQGSQAELCPEA